VAFIDVQLRVQFPQSASACRIVGDEAVQFDEEGVELTAFIEGQDPIVVFSNRSVFDALKKIRLRLEEIGGLLVCFASDEAVYPSPMQEAMGLNTLAYRHRLGKQALKEDIVDIFNTDDSVKSVSVAEQESFHQRWFGSL
jgi:hypothetical protein